MSDPEKIEQLRDLLATVVKNTKDGKTSATEARQTKSVLKTMLGRNPTESEVQDAMAN